MENELKLIKVDTDKYILCFDSIGDKHQLLEKKELIIHGDSYEFRKCGNKKCRGYPIYD